MEKMNNEKIRYGKYKIISNAPKEEFLGFIDIIRKNTIIKSEGTEAVIYIPVEHIPRVMEYGIVHFTNVRRYHNEDISELLENTDKNLVKVFEYIRVLITNIVSEYKNIIVKKAVEIQTSSYKIQELIKQNNGIRE